MFDTRVDYLPSSLLNLQFGPKFNHPIDYLPPTLSFLNGEPYKQGYYPPVIDEYENMFF